MHTLYYANGTAALPVHILLEEIGAPYETVRIDFAKRAQTSPDYLAINPKGRVPSLVTPDGILTETPAILAYLAQRFPEKALAPQDAFNFARAQSFNAYLAATVHVNHAHRHRGARWSDDPSCWDSMTAKVASNMTECAAMIEQHYLDGPWVLGAAYSMCDPYLHLIARWLPVDGCDRAAFPKIQAHYEAMLARPATARITALHD